MASRVPGEQASSEHQFHRADWPFYWIARVNALYTQEMERVLKVVNCDISTWRVLAILQEQGVSSVSDIALHSVSKLSTTTKIVYRMKADGLVSTSASTQDGRVTLVELTPAGCQQLQRVADATHGLFQRSFDGLTPARVEGRKEGGRRRCGHGPAARPPMSGHARRGARAAAQVLSIAWCRPCRPR